jgi:hypothetical protein
LNIAKKQAQNMGPATETATGLICLLDKLLCQYGRDIDADNKMIRCLTMSGFLIATCSMEPDLTVYRIAQLDNEQNVLQLFAATCHWGSGTTDLQLYRDGPWEGIFREISTETVNLGQSEP